MKSDVNVQCFKISISAFNNTIIHSHNTLVIIIDTNIIKKKILGCGKVNEKEIMRFIQDKIPIILDIESQELKFDTRSIYYKIYKYIYELREENKKK